MIYEKKSRSKSNFQLVSANFPFRAEFKKVTSRAELKIFQLEPARLGPITKSYAPSSPGKFCFVIFKNQNVKKRPKCKEKKHNAKKKKCKEKIQNV